MSANIIIKLIFSAGFAISLVGQAVCALPKFGKYSVYYADAFGTEIAISSYPEDEEGDLVIPATIFGKPVTEIGPFAFAYGSLSSITLPASVKRIKDGAFKESSSLTAVNLPAGVKTIGSSAFADCASLASITLPDGLRSLGGSAFNDCISLTEIIIPPGLKRIEGSTFSECDNLKSVTIPYGVTYIGYASFERSYGLEHVTIAPTVTEIDDNAFDYCEGLESILFLGNAPKVGDAVFANGSEDAKIRFIAGKTGYDTPFWSGLGAVAVTGKSEIEVQQPHDKILVNGTASIRFGTVKVGEASNSKTFTIINRGTTELTGIAVAKSDGNKMDFTITQVSKTSLAAGESTTFKVTFKPKKEGPRLATVRIVSNDANESPFDIVVSGKGAP